MSGSSSAEAILANGGRRRQAPAGALPELGSDHLHLGCGLCSPSGWLNVDGSWRAVVARHRWLERLLIVLGITPAKGAGVWGTNVLRLNLVKPLPFADASFTTIYSSHTLEHLYRDDARGLLRECFRVLLPGGICRIVVPDLKAFVDRYAAESVEGSPSAADGLMARLNTHPRQAGRGLLAVYYRLTAFHIHKWMYDGASLVALLREAGFVDVSVRACMDSAIERIEEVEDPGRLLGGEGVAVEGRKPANRHAANHDIQR